MAESRRLRLKCFVTFQGHNSLSHFSLNAGVAHANRLVIYMYLVFPNQSTLRQLFHLNSCIVCVHLQCSLYFYKKKTNVILTSLVASSTVNKNSSQIWAHIFFFLFLLSPYTGEIQCHGPKSQMAIWIHPLEVVNTHSNFHGILASYLWCQDIIGLKMTWSKMLNLWTRHHPCKTCRG